MKLKIDKESDALYLRLSEAPVVESEEIKPGIVLDYDDKGRIVGIEILSLSELTSHDGTLQLETTL